MFSRTKPRHYSFPKVQDDFSELPELAAACPQIDAQALISAKLHTAAQCTGGMR
jgi:hypothetical protein